ncbi:N-acetylaspartate synthetase [Desmophyllum pertusum]|uniref:N-acetylaspartate synthetase n=1 Tax=Desmophyllum pertusum TaxID=174260 RepID=A0A9W9YSS1_9CNID|nr:N-acetylaspartate synthetase [Desmophyllum pertusum]
MFTVNDNKQVVPTVMHRPSMEGVRIRSYDNTDYNECREIFTEGMQQLINLITRVVFPKFLWYIAVATILAIMASLKWSIWIFIVSVFICVVLSALLYVHIYLECWNYINDCLKADLMDIDKSYMSNEGSHMWVAEWNGKVVGMVGLIHHEDHKPGVAELQRMSVSTTCRKMGIARKLLDELLKHAREQRFEKIILTTTSAQGPAVGLYKKYGFKLMAVFPFPQKILKDMEHWSFDLQL